MGRTAKTQRLTALTVRKYAGDPSSQTPLHDGGGLYLRKRGAALHWTLRLTGPASGTELWHRLFPGDPLGPTRTRASLMRAPRRGGCAPALVRHRPARQASAPDSSP